jgi:DNA-binding CsgD family transcriptional regulator
VPRRRTIAAIKNGTYSGEISDAKFEELLGALAEAPLVRESDIDDEHRWLTPRERQVVAKLIKGKSPKRVAVELGIGYRTVRQHMKRIYEVYDVHSLHQLIVAELRRDEPEYSIRRIPRLMNQPDQPDPDFFQIRDWVQERIDQMGGVDIARPKEQFTLTAWRALCKHLGVGKKRKKKALTIEESMDLIRKEIGPEG